MAACIQGVEPLEWSARLATGVLAIDEQHKMLFRIAHDYRLAFDEGRGERVYALLLTTLHDYARGHFGLEDKCMYRYACPIAAVNSAAHTTFLDALARFDSRYRAHGFDERDAQALLDYVDGWLTDHIGLIDVQLRGCAPQA